MKEKERILFLDQGETLGGGERFLLDFFKLLKEKDIQRLRPVLLGGKHSEYRQKLPDNIPRYDFFFPSVKGNIFLKALAGINILRSAAKLKKAIRTFQAKTIVTNSPRANFIALMTKMFFRSPVRWVIIVHDLNTQKAWWKYLHLWLRRQMGRYADCMVAVSLQTRAHLRQWIHERNFSKIRIIENGLDFENIPTPKPPTEIRKILLLGRIDPRKGQMYALEAADLLQERNPDLEFVIVGDPFAGDPDTVEYAQKLRDFAEKRHLRNVRFESAVSEPFRTMRKADCVLVLSTQAETFGRIVIEGMSMGKLVLAFDETGPREIMKQYEKFLKLKHSPLLVEKGNAMSLAETIGFFADHPEEISRYTEKARAFVEANFSAQETKKRLFEAIIH